MAGLVNPARRAHRSADSFERVDGESEMQKNSGKKKEKCKNCEGKGLIKNGDKKMKCQRCGGTGFKS
jgi:DnaJ-class molecular chaperone